MIALEENPEQEKERLAKEVAETKRRDALLAKDEATLAQNQINQLQQADADRDIKEQGTEFTKYE